MCSICSIGQTHLIAIIFLIIQQILHVLELIAQTAVGFLHVLHVVHQDLYLLPQVLLTPRFIIYLLEAYT